MNRGSFYNINTITGDEHLGEDICTDLYDYYVYGGRIFNYEINISSEEFSEIFSVINSSIESVLSTKEVKKAFLQYVQLIMADARDGKFVDACYFVNCIDYIGLPILDNKFLKKIKKIVGPIKKSLNGRFVSSNKIKK